MLTFKSPENFTNLDYSATIWIEREIQNMSTKGISDESDPILGDAFNAFLDHVVTILITCASYDWSIEFWD